MINYIKFFISITIIVGLLIPSYATSGSVDGDAFLTKEEFDKALSNFNNRLDRFEAGINSKIDSQVSSYLDRNGIWNAKKQDINPSFSAEAGFLVASDNNITAYPKGFTGSNSTSALVPKANIYTITGNELVKEITKLGLCRVDLKINTSLTGASYTECRIACSGSDNYPLNHNDYIYIEFRIKDGDGNEKYVWTYKYGILSSTRFPNDEPVRENIYFFVKKKDKLIVEANMSVGSHEFGDWGRKYGAKWKKTFEPQEVVVY